MFQVGYNIDKEPNSKSNQILERNKQGKLVSRSNQEEMSKHMGNNIVSRTNQEELAKHVGNNLASRRSQEELTKQIGNNVVSRSNQEDPSMKHLGNNLAVGNEQEQESKVEDPLMEMLQQLQEAADYSPTEVSSTLIASKTPSPSVNVGSIPEFTL